MNYLSRVLSLCIVSLGISTSSFACEPADSGAPHLRLNSSLPQAKEVYLFQVGEQVFNDIISGKGFDALNSNVFKDLDLDSFYSNVEYSQLAKAKFLSNGLRWALSGSDETYNKTRKNYLTAIVASCWHIKNLAGKNNELFEAGSFTLIDPQHRFYNFLLGYVLLVNGASDVSKLSSYYTTTSNLAYPRDPKKGLSSHHKTRSPEGQYGIDVRYEPYQCVLMMLPFLKTHVLFGKLDLGQNEPLTFLKLEEMGMGTISAVAIHTVNFANTRGESAHDSRKEKNIPQPIKDAFNLFKERHSLTQEATTISEMHKLASSVVSAPATPGTSNEFIDFLKSFYPDGRPDLRVGNEVILDLTKVNKS